MSKHESKRARSIKKATTKKVFDSSFPIVGIGASAGGLEACTDFLQHLPTDTGMAFVLVQHLDPQHKSALTQILARETSMLVREATNSLLVKPNCFYVIPPNKDLIIKKGVIKLRPRPIIRGAHRSIDSFFQSLAQDQKECAIGIVLSGTATDGTDGLEMIKSEGGITFAQDSTAKYESMPRHAAASGCVDFVLSPREIAKELARIAKHPYLKGHALPLEIQAKRDNRIKVVNKSASDAEESLPVENDGFKKILLLLRNHSGVDFALYKSNTILRRTHRRMLLNRQRTMNDYADFLKGNTKELEALYSDVLIGVTSFFRDPEAFEALKAKVFPKLLDQSRRGEGLVRVWTLGCSTGQEAYSIAMAFTEFCDNAPRAPKIQIFATDLNDPLLEKARHGVYPKTISGDMPETRLKRFFVEEEGGYGGIAEKKVELRVVDLENLVYMAAKSVQGEGDHWKHAKLELTGPWPKVLAHEETLSPVVGHLLENALKFVAPEVTPKVRVRTEENGEFIRLWVEDNGIGVAADHHEQIFKLFTRLHSDKYGGTGAGLAIVKKGLERMSGRCGVESAPKKGSRFWIDLKKA